MTRLSGIAGNPFLLPGTYGVPAWDELSELDVARNYAPMIDTAICWAGFYKRHYVYGNDILLNRPESSLCPIEITDGKKDEPILDVEYSLVEV